MGCCRKDVRGHFCGSRLAYDGTGAVARDQKITACVYFRQENDIIATCQHRTILEQDILSENF